MRLKREQFTESIEVYKMEMPTFGEIGFSVQFEAEGTPLPTQKYYYTCNGTYICSETGGVFGTDCSGNQTNRAIGELIYQGY